MDNEVGSSLRDLGSGRRLRTSGFGAKTGCSGVRHIRPGMRLFADEAMPQLSKIDLHNGHIKKDAGWLWLFFLDL
jgi:hypothetical protein